MGLYDFKPQFVPHILSGSKTHTIRGPRSFPDKPGSTMHLYTGLRHRGALLLMRVPCTKVEPIEIDGWGVIWVGGEFLDADEQEQLACRDGFESYAEMIAFWEGRLPFKGHIYHWRKP